VRNFQNRFWKLGCMSSTAPSSTVSPRSRVGRPRRVQMQAVIDAAIEIGLDQVTLKQVAERIGVAPATLYMHVRNRDELVRLATFQLMLSRRMPSAEVAHWSALAALYAEALYEAFLAQPLLLHELLRGRLGPHAEVDILEQFLAAMNRLGLDDAEGVRLFHAIGMVVIGAAAGAIGMRAAAGGEDDWGQAMQRVLGEPRAAKLSRVRQALPAAMAAPYQWMPVLQATLSGFAAARGEALPETMPSATRTATQIAEGDPS
jgi:AcrR family transcriptional regulator